MNHSKSYRFFAVLLLWAFCHSLVVKTLHHHAVLPVGDIVCAIDHVSLSDHAAHHHASLLPFLQDADDNCAICHFQWVKIACPAQPLTLQAVQQTAWTADCRTYHWRTSELYAWSQRGPPVQ